MFIPVTQANRRRLVTTSSTSVTLDATVGTLLCQVSSDGSVTVPAAASNPDVDFIIKNIGSGSAKVTLNRSGSDTIESGTSYILYLHGDWVRIQSDGTNWHVVGGYLKPHACRVYRSSPQLLSASTYNRINFNAAVFDRGGIADITTNGRIEIRRTGVYEITGYFGADNSSNNFTVAQIWVDGAVVAVSTLKTTNSAAYTRVLGNLTQTISAGSYIDWYCNPGGSNYTPPTDSAGSPWLAVTEVR